MKHLSVLVIFITIFIIDTKTVYIFTAQIRPTKETTELVECSSDIVTNAEGEKFHWQYIKNAEFKYFTAKKPVCWDVNKNVVVRRCQLETGNWKPENKNIKCASSQKRNQFCPEDLTEIPIVNEKDKFLCIKLSTKPHKWNENACYGSDTLIDSSISQNLLQSLSTFLKEKKIESFWLPASRPTHTKYSPFVWRLPGEHWGELLDVNKMTTRAEYEQSLNANCLVVNIANDRLNKKVTHCESEFHSMCVFQKHFIASSGCPQNFKALSYRPNECYGINWQEQHIANELQPLTMPEYYNKQNILRLVFDAIDMKSDLFFLLGETEVDGIEVNVEMNAKEEIRIKPRNKMKSALSTEILRARKNVEMTLKIDTENGGLILTVYNRNYIWKVEDDGNNYGIKCFTNADYELCSDVDIEDMIWENERQTKSMFELKLHGDGPGYYWCEAHTVFNFDLVNTTKVIATKQQKGHPFAAFFDVPCTVDTCSSPYGELKQMAKKIKKTLCDYKQKKEYKSKFHELIIHNVRIMKIESINIRSTTMRVLCHITASKKSSSVDNKDENSSEENDSEENEFGIRHDTNVRLQLRDLLKDLLALENPKLSETVKSTEFCFPQKFTMVNGEANQWYLAKYGQTSTTQKLCLQRNGLPATRECKGDFLYGAFWEPFSAKTMLCITDTVESIITKNLYELDSSKLSKKSPKEVVNNLQELLEQNINHLIPADFYYMGRIMQSVSKSLFTDILHGSKFNTTITSTAALADNATEVTIEFVRIFNYLMKVNENIIQPSIKLNSTNVLLDAFENFIDRTSMLALTDTLDSSSATLGPPKTAKNSEINQKEMPVSIIEDSDKYVETIDYEDVGVVVNIMSKFVIFVINPNVANITGIAIFNSDEYSTEEFSEVGLLRGAFKDEFYRFVLANQSVSDLLNEPGLQLATYVPETLWNRLDEIALLSNHTTTPKSAARIVIKVYSNDILFQEERQAAHKKAFGKIISVSMPGRDKDLPEMLPLILRMNVDSESNETQGGCGYWNYKTWVSDGLVYLGRSDVDENLIVCGCTHLTPFAYLIGASFNFSIDSEESEIVIITKIHKAALDIITLLGCSLSLFGIAGITITAIAFETWRRKASSKVLLQLSAAIALQMILFCFVNTEEFSLHLIENEIFTSCIALGAALQYSVLVQFCWMAIIAYLQFKRYVQIFGNTRPKRFFIKSSLIGWGLPLLPVLCVLLLDRESYIPSYSAENGSICYPSGYSLYFGVIIPIIFVIIANLGIFLIIIYNVLRGPDGAIRHTEKKQVLSQIRLTFLLFFLLGFTWIFGLLNFMKAGILFSYLFCLTATLQGFVLFMYFIILDPITRRMWCGCLRRVFKLNRDFENSNSMKETTTIH